MEAVTHDEFTKLPPSACWAKLIFLSSILALISFAIGRRSKAEDKKRNENKQSRRRTINIKTHSLANQDFLEIIALLANFSPQKILFCPLNHTNKA